MDLYIFNLVNQFALKWFWLDVFVIFLAEYFGYFLFLSLLLFLTVRFRKYFKMIIKAVISAILARFVIVELIRWIWQRPRPFLENNVNLLLSSDKPSFPSGHAAFYFGLSTIVYFYNKKIGILFFIGSFLICLARVFVGIHWPTDVLVGAAIGVLFACLIKKILK